VRKAVRTTAATPRREWPALRAGDFGGRVLRGRRKSLGVRVFSSRVSRVSLAAPYSHAVQQCSTRFSCEPSRLRATPERSPDRHPPHRENSTSPPAYAKHHRAMPSIITVKAASSRLQRIVPVIRDLTLAGRSAPPHFAKVLQRSIKRLLGHVQRLVRDDTKSS